MFNPQWPAPWLLHSYPG